MIHFYFFKSTVCIHLSSIFTPHIYSMKPFCLKFLLILLFLGIFACSEEIPPHWRILDAELFLLNTESTNTDELTILDDSVSLQIELTPRYLFAKNNLRSPFQPSALYAYSPVEWGSDGIFYPVDDIVFSCNKPLGGIPAGENINQYFELDTSYMYFSSFLPEDDIEQLKMVINTPSYSSPQFTFNGWLALPAEPQDSLVISMTIITTNDTIVSESPLFHWQQ
jgi:hypothetical protein